MKIKYKLTENNAIVSDGKKTWTVSKTDANFPLLRKAIIDEDETEILAAAQKDRKHVVKKWGNKRVSIETGKYTIDGEEIPAALASKIEKIIAAGKSGDALLAFWDRLKLNPSYNSVQQLFSFLEKNDFPLTRQGTFLAYKSVLSGSFLDHHSRTIENKVGSVIEMQRNLISDDPHTPCHVGLHVGALPYVKGFGGGESTIVICEVDPKDVVSVPVDSSHQKMRVCKYEVIGLMGDEMDNTVDDYADDLKSDNSSRFAELDAMSYNELLTVNMDELRKYASSHLKIVGAYKIKGGKFKLLNVIKKYR